MTSPFTSQAVPFSGIDPGGASQQYGSRRLWLGKPGNMIELPSKATQYQANLSSGAVQHNLYGGAVAVTRFYNAARSWSLTFPYLVGRDYQVVNGFYRRMFGNGPWVFVPPEDVNRLPMATSMCGAYNGDITGWAASAGTVTADTSSSPVPPCGVLRWAGATTGDKLGAVSAYASGAPSVDVNAAAPYLSAEPVAVACQVKTATGSASVQIVAAGFDVNGAVLSQTVLATVTASSTVWTPLAASVAPGGLGSAVFVALQLVCQTATAPALLISVPSLSYTDFIPDWEAGAGVPRVVWPTDPARGLSLVLASNVTMQLSESILGAI